MGSSGKKRKGQRKKDEDSNVNADTIPEYSREIVQNMKEILNCSEQEIYSMLVECNMNADEAINRLLSQDSFQEVKSKRNKKKEAKEKSRMGERDEGSNVNADSVPVDFKEVVQNVQEIVKCSEEETKKVLVECNMDADKAVNRLLSQDSVQQVKSNQDEKKEDTSDFQRVGSSNQNRELRNGSDNYVGQGGGNKFDSDETSNAQGIRNQLTSSSTTAGILGPGPPLNRNILNVKTKRVPTRSGETVPSLYVPSSRLIPAWGCGTTGQRTMADVLKMGLTTSTESVTKAPVKDDCPLPERPNESAARRYQLRESASVSDQNLCDDDFACPLSNSVIESAAGEDQLGESTSISNQNFRDDDYGGSQLLSNNHSNKNDVTEFEHNQNKDPPVSVVTSLLQLPTENDEPEAPVKELQHLRFGNYGSGMNGSVVVKMGIASLKESVTKGPLSLKDDCHLPERPDESAARRDESALVSNQNLHDNFSYFSNSIFEFDARKNQLRESASVSKQKFRDDGVTYPLSTSYDAKTEQFRKSTAEFIHNLRVDDVACPLSNSFVESAARGDHFGESTSSIFNQRFHDDDYGGSQLLCDNDNNKNDETYLVQRRSFIESASVFKQNLRNLRDDSVTYPLATSYDAEREQFLKFTPDIIQNLRVDDLASQLSTSFIEFAAISAKDPPASVVQQLSTENDEPEAYVKELKHWRFCSFGSGMNGSCQPSGLPSRFLDDDDSEDISDFADDLSLSYLNTRDGEFHEDEEQRLQINAANGQTEPTQENQYESSSATDFIFDNSQLFNPVVAPLGLQMQNINTFPAMRQQAYTREPDPQFSASPHNQSIPTTSSLCPRLLGSVTEALLNASISEPHMNQQAMNHHYSQPMVPSGNNGNMMNYPYSQTTQNDTYNRSPSAFQQHGGRNNNSYHLRSLNALLPHYRNSVLSPYAVPFVPSTHSSAYGSTNGSTHGFGTLSDNAPNLRFEYEDDFHTQFSNHLATLQHQNGTSCMWTPQGLNDSGSSYYSLYSGPQNQQSQSLRHSQQQQQKEPEQTYRRIWLRKCGFCFN